ncbi:hypothetical protein [Nocardia sp. NPDC047038]
MARNPYSGLVLIKVTTVPGVLMAIPFGVVVSVQVGNMQGLTALG